MSIYTYKDVNLLTQALCKAKVHRLEDVEIFAFDSNALEQLGLTLDRNNQWVVVRNDGILFVTSGLSTIEFPIERHPAIL